MKYSLTNDGEYTDAIPTGTDANEYTVWYKVIGDSNHNDTEPASVKVTIKKATPTVTAPVAVEDLVESDNEQALVTAGSTDFGTLVYSLAENGDYTAEIPAAKDAGEYTVWYKVIGDDNIMDVAAASVTVTIQEREVEEVLGDFDDNGYVDNEDVIYLLWHYLYPEDYSIGDAFADFNHDGNVDNEDVISLLWFYLYPEEYPLVR